MTDICVPSIFMKQRMRPRKLFKIYIILLQLCLAIFCSTAKAQPFKNLFNKKKKTVVKLPEPAAPDKKYIADYHKELTIRTFGSRKYATYGLHDKGFAQNIQYRPNSPFNVGVGINYRIIGLNLGFNLPVINNNTERGETKFIDLQSHLYGRKLIIDLYLQRYKGFYMTNTAAIQNNNQNEIYIRPDIVNFNAGLIVHYILNGDKFSFRGAFLQNEVQLKSAGSPLFGASIYSYNIRSDSSVIPYKLNAPEYFNGNHFNHSSVKSISGNFGYGYTFVLPYHFFITAAGNVGVGINYTVLKSIDMDKYSGAGTDITGTIRLGLGYNSRRYFAGIHYTGSTLSSSTPISYARQEFGAGNFRISLARRFTLKKKLLGFY